MDSPTAPPDLRLSPPGGADREGIRVSRKSLVNRLNFLSFQDQPLVVTLRHKKFDRTLVVEAVPDPCSGDRLVCRWSDPTLLERKLGRYVFQDLRLSDGRGFLLVEAEPVAMDGREITLLLPDSCRDAGTRRVQRHRCTGIDARLTQNGAQVPARLEDFSAAAFRVRLAPPVPRPLPWIDPDIPVWVTLHDGPLDLFSGECRIVRQGEGGEAATLVLEPLHHQARRFRPRRHRSLRQQLVPSPSLRFTHPLTRSPVRLKLHDLSGSGFSVMEDAASAVLIPGMAIPAAEISIAGSFRVECALQVVYRADAGEGEVRCGLAIVDMEAGDHLRLMALLQQASESTSALCGPVDMELLWQFFFETGFLYPEKYVALRENKGSLLRLYERLYNGSPGIARHFVCQEKGVILGHMAMVRCYTDSWLIHHHAATRADAGKAGRAVLGQVSRYVNDLHRLPSAHLRYVFCYYREENRFPHRVFGGFARQLRDPAGCSLDTFDYFHFRRPEGEPGLLPAPWTLGEAGPDDLEELAAFYRHGSAGLMVEAFDLSPEHGGRDDLSEEYRRAGFIRERHLLALRHDGELKSLVMAQVADIGLNLSDLTGATTVMMLDAIPPGVLVSALSAVSTRYERGGMPVLVYPPSRALRETIPREKTYVLWILNLEYLDHYFSYCDTLFHAGMKAEPLSTGMT